MSEHYKTKLNKLPGYEYPEIHAWLLPFSVVGSMK